MNYNNNYSIFYTTFAIITHANCFTKLTWITDNSRAYDETCGPE
jgi:hypothetical protein